MAEHHYRIDHGQKDLFVRGERSTGWQVWLDHDQDFDGVHLASGADREKAIAGAVEVLLECVRTLRETQASGGVKIT
jgi:hypothetical protein